MMNAKKKNKTGKWVLSRSMKGLRIYLQANALIWNRFVDVCRRHKTPGQRLKTLLLTTNSTQNIRLCHFSRLNSHREMRRPANAYTQWLYYRRGILSLGNPNFLQRMVSPPDLSSRRNTTFFHIGSNHASLCYMGQNYFYLTGLLAIRTALKWYSRIKGYQCFTGCTETWETHGALSPSNINPSFHQICSICLIQHLIKATTNRMATSKMRSILMPTMPPSA